MASSPGVAERRVADVMGEAGRLDDHAEIGGAAPLRQVIAKDFADAHAERAPHAAHFERMGKPGMDMVVTGNRMDLGLAAEAAKRAGENDTVMILVERAAPQLVAAMSGLAESFTGKQCVPVQDHLHIAISGLVQSYHNRPTANRYYRTMRPARAGSLTQLKLDRAASTTGVAPAVSATFRAASAGL